MNTDDKLTAARFGEVAWFSAFIVVLIVHLGWFDTELGKFAVMMAGAAFVTGVTVSVLYRLYAPRTV